MVPLRLAKAVITNLCYYLMVMLLLELAESKGLPKRVALLSAALFGIEGGGVSISGIAANHEGQVVLLTRV